MGVGFNFAGKRPRLKRGVLRYALLYLLNDRARHGYDLIRACRALGLGSPSPGSIYPLLAILESDGLVTSRDEGERRVYEITESGRHVLREHPLGLQEFLAHSGAEAQPDDDTMRLEGSTRRLVYALSLLGTDAAPTTVSRACDLLDATRRKIYALLALE